MYPATIVGIPPQEDAWLGKATERIFLAPMKMMMIPEIVDMEMPVEGVFHNLVIAQIHKTFAGHGQKVMSAMWGAGQMMFNKILVLVDEGVSITDYLSLAKYVFKNMNPATDIAFAQGPMDVLDHSCSKLGKGQVRDLHHAFAEKISAGSGIKIILYIDDTIDPSNLPVALWRFCNNLDPKRDSFLFEGRAGEKIHACMGFDGTTKTEAMDDFHRDWPNIIVADEKTIEAVDNKWSMLGLGDLIPSPSLSFRDQLYGEEAVAAV